MGTVGYAQRQDELRRSLRAQHESDTQSLRVALQEAEAKATAAATETAAAKIAVRKGAEEAVAAMKRMEEVEEAAAAEIEWLDESLAR
eukprot:COSAG04_NODE_4677_length_1953_cov_1.805825_1_plen_87_part_10